MRLRHHVELWSWAEHPRGALGRGRPDSCPGWSWSKSTCSINRGALGFVGRAASHHDGICRGENGLPTFKFAIT